MTTFTVPPPTTETVTSTAAGRLVIELPRSRITHRESAEPITPHRSAWLPGAYQRDAILSSDAAFLVSCAIMWLLSGVMAYAYALWMIGPV
jgi:hypothetical protein